jgi:hypothetical protein
VTRFLDIGAGLSSARYIVTAPDPVAACRPGWVRWAGPGLEACGLVQTCRGTTRNLANLAIAPVARLTEEIS